MAGFLEEVAMDVGIVEHKDTYWSNPRTVDGGQPRWSSEAHDQGFFIEMHAHSPNLTDGHSSPDMDK